MTTRPLLHPDRLLPPNPEVRAIARRLHETVADLPIISPHGHTDPAWFANDLPFGNPAELLIQPDHYVYRMLYSQGIALERLGIVANDGAAIEQDPRAVWRLFASNYHLFRGTPTRMWMDWVLAHVFGLNERLSSTNADTHYDHIAEALLSDACRPRALFDRFNIACLCTTEAPTDTLEHHRAIHQSGWDGRVITAFRPDPVVDPEHDDFRNQLALISTQTGEDAFGWDGYVAALRKRRAFFRSMGATSTDHGHPTAQTADLSDLDTRALFSRVTSAGGVTVDDAELFRARMLTEMAAMSVDDGLVMQIHPGSFRNHNPELFKRYGRDKGADIPTRTDYVRALKPMLDRFGNDTSLIIIVFTLDETSYARELAPLAGHYPALKLGPAWWFHDSPEGMRRYRQMVTETAGYANTVGFNDDTRAFLSIPARHDVARRMDCAHLAELVADHRLDEDEAVELAADLAVNLARAAYRL